MHRVFRLLLISLFTLPFAPAPAPAQEQDLGIAAVVNDEIVTSADLDARMRFVLATTGLSDTPETRARLRPQLARQLVDETLQLQEGAKYNVHPTDEDVSKAIASIEAQRGIPAGKLEGDLAKLDVPVDTFHRQIRAQLAWREIANKKLRPNVHVSEEEIDRARLRADEEKTSGGTTADQVKINVLALPVDKPGQEAQTRALADKLLNEIKRGASFEVVARELNTGGSAASAFWIAPSQLDPTVAQALEKTPVGNVTAPIRTADGYSIIQLIERQGARSLESTPEREVLLKDVLMKLKEDASPQEVDVLLSIGREMAKNPGTCIEQGIAGVGNMQDYDISVNFHSLRTSEMTDTIREIVDGMDVGSVSQPFATPEGIRFFLLCERVDAAPKMLDRDEVFNRLSQQKLMLESQKYMRNLRRDAVIDVRV